MSDSIFIQLGTIDTQVLSDALEAAHSEGRYVDLCVTQVADRDNGFLYEHKLQILDPYLPWGEKAAFANVFFGTAVDYRGHAAPYGADMTDADFRWKQLNLQKLVAARISGRYLGRPYHFYIEHEAPLDHLENFHVRAGYEAFLIQSIKDFNSLNPNASILWSPAFWRAEPQANLNLQGFFDRVAQYAGRPIDWLHLQDMQGRGRDDLPRESVRRWFKALPKFASKRVNMELFKKVEGGLTHEDADVIDARKAWYSSKGLPIGISWELRYDHAARKQASEPAPTPAPEDTLVSISQSYTGASWPRFAAHNTWASRREQVATWLRTGQVTGSYAWRAIVNDDLGKRIHNVTGLEVQGRRYMRPYTPNPSTGRVVNSDHLTAGAIDIFITTAEERKWLPYIYEVLRILEERGVVRYIVRLGANAAHWNHIHVSLQIGVKP